MVGGRESPFALARGAIANSCTTFAMHAAIESKLLSLMDDPQ
jgi:hypothetical protein